MRGFVLILVGCLRQLLFLHSGRVFKLSIIKKDVRQFEGTYFSVENFSFHISCTNAINKKHYIQGVGNNGRTDFNVLQSLLKKLTCQILPNLEVF
jgi:hypothetical protein